MCLNGNFDTFCFDFTNVTKVTVRKYFGPPHEESGPRVYGRAAPTGPSERDWGCGEKRPWCQISSHFPGCICFLWVHQGGRNPSGPPVRSGTCGAASIADGTSFLFAHMEKNGETIQVGGPGTARNGGCGTVLVGTEGTGRLDGAHRNTVTRCRKKGDAWELLRGEMLNQHPPARPLRRQRLVVCNMPWGKGGSFSAYFPLHLCCLGVIGQSFLAEATPALHGSTKQEVLNTTGSTEGTLMWTREHTTVGVGGVFPLTPMEPLGSPSWGFPPHCSQPQAGISSAPGKAGLDSAWAGR